MVDHHPAALRDRPGRRARAGGRAARRHHPLPDASRSVAAVWQAACCVALAFADPFWLVYALVVVLQLGQVVANPAWVALVPEIAEPDEIGQAMGASQSLSTLAAVAAPAVAGVLAGTFGYGAPLLIDAATFAGLAAAALAIHATRRQSAADPATNAPPPAAFSLRKDALLWPLVLGVCALVLVGESTNVVEVFLLRGTLGAGTVVFGLVAAMLAVGRGRRLAVRRQERA